MNFSARVERLEKQLTAVKDVLARSERIRSDDQSQNVPTVRVGSNGDINSTIITMQADIMKEQADIIKGQEERIKEQAETISKQAANIKRLGEEGMVFAAIAEAFRMQNPDVPKTTAVLSGFWSTEEELKKGAEPTPPTAPHSPRRSS